MPAATDWARRGNSGVASSSDRPISHTSLPEPFPSVGEPDPTALGRASCPFRNFPVGIEHVGRRAPTNAIHFVVIPGWAKFQYRINRIALHNPFASFESLEKSKRLQYSADTLGTMKTIQEDKNRLTMKLGMAHNPLKGVKGLSVKTASPARLGSRSDIPR